MTPLLGPPVSNRLGIFLEPVKNRRSQGLICLIMILCGCASDQRPIVTADPITPDAPLVQPVTGDDWRAESQRLRDLLDSKRQAVAALTEQVHSATARADQADQEASRAEARTQAAWGRRIAFLLLIASTVAGIFSFTPWGWWLPRWAGPAGIAASTALLTAASVWPWIADHALLFGLVALAGGAVAGLIVVLRVGLLAKIRATFAQAVENAVDAAGLLQAKAAALEAELAAGVHRLSQRQRGKPAKSADQVAALRDQALRLRALEPSTAIVLKE